jgi:Cytochrome c3
MRSFGKTRMKRFVSLMPAIVVGATAAFCLARAQQPPALLSSPMSTARRLLQPGWWPTKGDAPRKDYAGVESCAECHQREVLSQQRSSMARAASKASETELLRSRSSISLSQPPFLTAITRDLRGSTYTVTRGGEAMSGQILWTLGDGSMGQTFVLESAGRLFESQLSYYPLIAALDLTPGHVPGSPSDLERAFGKPLSTEDARQCFACHTTAASARGQLDQAHAAPGVTCEACHGPGARHVRAMTENQIEEGRAAILRPSSFDPVKLIDYCGACHRAPLDVEKAKDYIPINIRFQPYRLAKSRCWNRPDPRISCTACHNPHEQVVRDVAFYDAKCLACHAAKTTNTPDMKTDVRRDSSIAGKLAACPVSANQCVSCHMPRYKVSQMHGSFTDHDIRVVHPGDPFPL